MSKNQEKKSWVLKSFKKISVSETVKCTIFVLRVVGDFCTMNLHLFMVTYIYACDQIMMFKFLNHICYAAEDDILLCILGYLC